MENGSTREDRTGSEFRPDAVDPVVRAKYLDYCSARLAEVFLGLSDERIYRMVEEAAREHSYQLSELGFERMVKLVTDRLKTSVPLPDLQSWARDYGEHPERYDPYLMGFWKESAGEEPAGSEKESQGRAGQEPGPSGASGGREPAGPEGTSP